MGPFRLLLLIVLVLTSGALAQEDPQTPQGCLDPVDNCDTTVDYFEEKVVAKYAERLPKIDFSNTYVDVDEESLREDTTFKYRFVRCGCDAPAGVDDDRTVIYVPAASLFVGDSVVVGMIGTPEFNGLASIAAVPLMSTIASSDAWTRFNEGDIVEVGAADFSNNFKDLFNTEVLPETPPVSIITTFSLDSFEQNLATAQAEDAEITTVALLSQEVEETTPLGRAEHVKIFGILLHRIAEANKLFSTIDTEYNAAKELAVTIERVPSAMTNYPFGTTWSVANGISYIGQFLADANVDYRIQDAESPATLSLSAQEMSGNFSSADYWINISSFGTRFNTLNEVADSATISSSYPEVPSYESMQCGNAWANDADTYSEGVKVEQGTSNNFFELGVVEPNLILYDLIKLFHPGAFENREFRFYRKIAEGAFAGECPVPDLPSEAAAGFAYSSKSFTATGVSRFEVEDVQVSDLIPAVTEALDVQSDNVEINLQADRETPSQTDLTFVVNVEEEQADAMVEKLEGQEFYDAVFTVLMDIPSDSADVTLEPNPADGDNGGDGGDNGGDGGDNGGDGGDNGGDGGDNGGGGGLAAGWIVLIVFASLGVAALAATTFVYAQRRRRRRGFQESYGGVVEGPADNEVYE
ncbi:hypothetical protein NDN08_000779 [Rhodosorus marinus]|uniref:Fe/B12 periplasmic-binding domain-containing protein n=1 Tax=Rhodosorus marinus TaxID=101924 RepID=A0AAV8UNY5_9RHOD|nr:hypothetical protein NDN08_000779 [Rhodosorus marinus]